MFGSLRLCGSAALLATLVLALLAGDCSARSGPSRALLRIKAQNAITQGGDFEAARSLHPPVAPRHPHVMTINNDTRVDDYYWLRDDARKSPEVISYLQAENNYTNAVMASTKGLQAKLYQEMRSRIQEDDSSVPNRFKGYWYYARVSAGQQYSVHCRRAVPAGAPSLNEADVPDAASREEVVLDENRRKEEVGKAFYQVESLDVSPNQKLLAWTEDTDGGEKYTLHVKDLATGQELMEPVPMMSGSVMWGNDNTHLFYVVPDETNRPYRVWRHKLGSPNSEDVLVYEERDSGFFVNIGRDSSDQILYIRTGSAVTGEVLVLDANNATGDFKPILPRTPEVDYSVSYHPGDKPGGDWYLFNMRTTDRPNSELRVAPASNPQDQKVILAHRAAVQLDGSDVSQRYLVVNERANASTRVVVHRLAAGGAMPAAPLGPGEVISFDEAVYRLSGGLTGGWDSDVLRLSYESMTTPTSTIDHDIATGRRAVRKVRAVLGGFNKDDYNSERQWATAADGTRIPISLVYRRGAYKRDGSAPMLLYGYGSYGTPSDPAFNSKLISLLDRGWSMAIAHVRGGGDMGRLWYEDGKFFKKIHTFTDFIASAEYLIKNNYTSPNVLTIEGRSAGGMLMGAVLNQRPDLFRAAIAGVPFVDCLTTMLDESIPLTTNEFEEWGNPKDALFYSYMKSYSPVDNVRPQRYPTLLVTAGLHDPRVGYWEPAKWVAKLRATKTDKNVLLLKTNMGAGHFSVTGRFERLKDDAMEYAFLLKATGQEAIQPLAGTGAGAGAAAAAGAEVDADEVVRDAQE